MSWGSPGTLTWVECGAKYGSDEGHGDASKWKHHVKEWLWENLCSGNGRDAEIRDAKEDESEKERAMDARRRSNGPGVLCLIAS